MTRRAPADGSEWSTIVLLQLGAFFVGIGWVVGRGRAVALEGLDGAREADRHAAVAGWAGDRDVLRCDRRPGRRRADPGGRRGDRRAARRAPVCSTGAPNSRPLRSDWAASGSSPVAAGRSEGSECSLRGRACTGRNGGRARARRAGAGRTAARGSRSASRWPRTRPERCSSPASAARMTFPSAGDGFLLAFFPAACVAALLFARARLPRFGPALMLDAAIGTLGAAAVVTQLLAAQIQADTGSAFKTAVALAFPMGDVLLVVMVVVALTLRGWRVSAVWLLLAFGVLLRAVCDAVHVSAGLGATVPAWLDPGARARRRCSRSSPPPGARSGRRARSRSTAGARSSRRRCSRSSRPGCSSPTTSTGPSTRRSGSRPPRSSRCSAGWR